jgi:hypothetical protein
MASIAVGAQSPPKSAAQSEPEKQKKEQERKALLLLDELIETAQSLRLPENRAYLLSIAGDLLWQSDEKRARTLFSEAAQLVIPLVHLPEDSPDGIPQNSRWQLAQLRQQLVRLLLNHDPQLAGEFLLASRPPADRREGHFNDDEETRLELEIALKLAEKDPQRLLQRADEMLAAGKPLSQVANLLHTLREKNFEAAQKLAGLVLARFHAESPLRPDSIQVALNLMQYAPRPNDEAAKEASNRKALLSAADARALLEKAIAAAQAELAAAKQQNDQNQRNNAINLLNNFKSLSGYLEKNAPASLAALKRGWAESEKMMEPWQRGWEALNRLGEKQSPDLLIEAAANAPAEMRFHFFQRASQIATQQGDTERARQIIRDNVKEGSLRRSALREVDQQVMWRKVGENKFDEARQLAARGQTDAERAGTLASMASSALNADALNADKAKNREAALKLLDEAWALVEGPAESSQQFFSQLQIAGVYAPINPARGFEIIEATLDPFNELFAAAALLENFESHGGFRNKEMILLNGGRAFNYFRQYSQPLAALAAADLDRVRSLIGRFTRPEARASLQLIVLHQLLNRAPLGGTFSGIRRMHLLE